MDKIIKLEIEINLKIERLTRELTGLFFILFLEQYADELEEEVLIQAGKSGNRLVIVFLGARN